MADNKSAKPTNEGYEKRRYQDLVQMQAEVGSFMWSLERVILYLFLFLCSITTMQYLQHRSLSIAEVPN